MDCAELIQHPDTYELILSRDEAESYMENPPACIQPINENFEIWYLPKDNLPPLSIAEFSYSVIPNCYGLLDELSLEVSGIIKLQNLPTLSLKGQGVFVAVIDTGIAYTDTAFRNRDGSSRIYAIWDQTQTHDGSDWIRYGAEYSNEDINTALRSEEPFAVVPEQDTDGHGTLLASIACGSGDEAMDFIGAAPESELIVVKLKPAKQYLKEFFFIPEGTVAFAESDIMAGVAYAQRKAQQAGRPLVILLGLGTNNGSHTGTGPLCEFLDDVGVLRNRAIAVAAGNEANARHHFFGRAESVLSPLKVEINVEYDMAGFYVELWALAPEHFAVSIQSPTGEIVPRINPISGENQQIRFLFEGTEVSVDYRDAGRTRRDQLIFMRFSGVVRGIWTIQVFPENAVTGNFHMWLPMRGMLERDVFFLQPNPQTTLTSPSDARIPITVGGYQAATGALYLDSGRGFNADGVVKPDFLAPAVEVMGKGLRGNFVTATGTSAAAAITAGAAAQIFEWAVTQGNVMGINSVDVGNLLIRGAMREANQIYPSPEYGYGKLNVYDAFDTLRTR